MTKEFAQVLAGAKSNEAWAFREIYDNLAKSVTGYLRMQGGAEPDDLASETFLHVFNQIASFEGAESDFRSWVFTIAHRRLIDERRRSGRQIPTSPLEADVEVSGGDAESEAIAHLSEAHILDLIDELSDEQRSVVLLRIVADLSVREVARLLDKTPGAVKALTHRGLTTLRARLYERGVTE